MAAKLKLNGYHKNILYRQNVSLLRSKKFTRESANLASSVITAAIIIKSKASRQK
jgi:hypothetical protein